MSFRIVFLVFINMSNFIMSQTLDKMEKDNSHSLFIYLIDLNDEYKDTTNWTNETHSTMKLHVEFLDQLAEKGVLIIAGRTDVDLQDENLLGLVIIKASSLKDAKQIMNEDPGIIYNLQKASIFPFVLAKERLENF